jgi:hypothetical protein
MSNSASYQLKSEVEQLAAIAYFQHLISGHGNGEHPDRYQIVIQGRPKHYLLEEAHAVLTQMLEQPLALANSLGHLTAGFGLDCKLIS